MSNSLDTQVPTNPTLEPSEKESEVILINTYAGFVDKQELRSKVFNHSKYHFLAAVKAFRRFSLQFDQLYEPFHLKNLLPIFLVKLFLQHNEVEFKFVH